MNPQYIAAIARSMQEVASMMLDLPVQLGKPALRTDLSGTYDVSAIIGLSGDCVGSVALSFPFDTAAALVSRFVGSAVTAEDAAFGDGVGEIANMVTGGAKANFHDRDVSISCPSVIVGPGHRVFQQREVPVVEIPVESDAGPFVLLVSIREAATEPQRAAG